MAVTTFLQDYVHHNKLQTSKVYEFDSRTCIHFSIYDVFFRQHQIASLWRALNQNEYKPIAKTFLGKVISISILP